MAQRSAVRWQFVGDEGIRDEALVFEQLSHQFQCRSLVAPALNQDIQDLAFTIYCTPEVHALAIDQDKHLVQVPTPIRAGTQSPERAGIAQPELQRPAPDGLIGDVDTPLREQVLDVPIAQRKPEIEPHRMLDN